MSKGVQNLKQHGDLSSAANRAILSGVHGAIPTADPAATEKGYALHAADNLHVYAEMTGGITALSVTPWFWSDIAGQWFEGAQINFTATSKMAHVAAKQEQKVFFVVDAVTGTGTWALWAGYSYEGEPAA